MVVTGTGRRLQERCHTCARIVVILVVVEITVQICCGTCLVQILLGGLTHEEIAYICPVCIIAVMESIAVLLVF